MNKCEVEQLAKTGTFQQLALNGKLIETHISWIIFTQKHAFKIKKPVKLSFLNFSTLPLRKKFCHKELQLNSRYTNIYLKVVPIYQLENTYYIGEGRGKIIDYALCMKKMQQAKRMDHLLIERRVTQDQIKQLAHKVASFHQKTQKIEGQYDIQLSKNIFNDLLEKKEFCKKEIGEKYANIIPKSIDWSDHFLLKHAGNLQQRFNAGWKRDLHGDLHSGNIFLYKDPVIFDCIEFNDDYRKIDVLYEIAFLCMDLEYYNQASLSDTFIKVYLQKLPCIKNQEDKSIFNYFKCSRANIRAKVHLTSAQQSVNPEDAQNYLKQAVRYLDLMEKYMNTDLRFGY